MREFARSSAARGVALFSIRPRACTAATVLLGTVLTSSLAAHLDREELAYRIEGAVAIDGSLEEWGALVRDSQARVAARWDDSALYLAFRVIDSEVCIHPNPREIYLGDCIEIGLDLRNDSAFEYEVDDFQFGVSAPDRSGLIQMGLFRHAGKRLDVKSYLTAAGGRTDDGYTVEMRLDWSAMGRAQPAEGESIGFEYVITDLQEDGSVARFRWSGKDHSLNEPIRWGDLILIEEGRGVAETTRAELFEHRAIARSRFEAQYMDPSSPVELSESVLRDMDTLRTRLVEQMRKPISPAKIRSYLDSVSQDGSWPELTYLSDEGFGTAEAERHLFWLIDLAIAYRFETDFDDQESILDTLNRCFEYWLRSDIQFTNWWHNEIGVPMRLASVALLMGDRLTEGQRNRLLPILRRARKRMTGQNLIWINQVILYRGILERNPALIQKALDAISGEIAITTGEGIQPDFSFHQHGSQLYNHGYGAVFVTDGVRLLASAAGGSFEMPSAKRRILESYLLDGSRWMARGGFLDFGANGRNNTRRNQSAEYLAEVATCLLAFSTDREEELRALRDSIRNGSADTLEGNRHFYRSDFMVHRRSAYYASIKMYSTRTIGTESMNGEGLRNYFLPDGCMLVVRRGDEYAGIQPLWNWRQIPGVTAPQSDDPIPSVNPRKTRTSGNTSFVGGVSDGQNGCAAFDYDRDGISVRKGYFCFDWGVVCLGANLSSTRSEPIFTTLNQCFLRSGVLYGENSTSGPSVLRLGETYSDRVKWIHHDEILYTFDKPAKVTMEATEREGSWWTINRGESKEPVQGNVFSLAMEHGAQPNGAGYAYAVLPGVTENGIAEKLRQRSFEVLENVSMLQAVIDRKAGVVECIFYAPGTLMFPSGESITVDQPCLLMLTIGEEQSCFTASNPDGDALRVNVEFKPTASADPVRIEFQLPGGLELGGSSVSRMVTLPVSPL